MLARLGKSARIVARIGRCFSDEANPKLTNRSAYKLPGSEGETDSLGANFGKKFGRKTLTSTYNPLEFTPYKLPRDRTDFINEYTLSEGYNVSFPGKQSKTIRTSMMQDNIVILMIIALTMFLMFERRKANQDYMDAYKEYMESQLSEVRQLPNPSQDSS